MKSKKKKITSTQRNTTHTHNHAGKEKISNTVRSISLHKWINEEKVLSKIIVTNHHSINKVKSNICWWFLGEVCSLQIRVISRHWRGGFSFIFWPVDHAVGRILFKFRFFPLPLLYSIKFKIYYLKGNKKSTCLKQNKNKIRQVWLKLI